MTNQAVNHATSVFASSQKVSFARKNTFLEFLAELNEGHYEYTNFIYDEKSASFDTILAFPNKRFLELKKGVSIKFFGYDGKVTISAKGKVTLTYHQREDKEYCLSEAQEDKFQVNEENMLKFEKAFDLFCSGRFKHLYTIREIFLYFLNLTDAATKVVEIDLGGIEENDCEVYLALKQVYLLSLFFCIYFYAALPLSSLSAQTQTQRKTQNEVYIHLWAASSLQNLFRALG